MAWGIYLRLGGCVLGLWDHDVGWDYFSCSYGLFLPVSLAGRAPVRVGSLWSVHGHQFFFCFFFSCVGTKAPQRRKCRGVGHQLAFFNVKNFTSLVA